MEEPQEIDPKQNLEQQVELDKLNEALSRPKEELNLADINAGVSNFIPTNPERRRKFRPHNEVLAEQTSFVERRQTLPSAPKADITAHTANPEELQATIIATLKNRPLSEGELVRAIVVERGIKSDSQVVKNIAMRVHRALQDPLVAKRLIRNGDGTLGLEASTLVGGGSDLSLTPKEKPSEDVKAPSKEKFSLIEQMNKAVYGVEDFLTEDVGKKVKTFLVDMDKKTIDPSGGAFLGETKFSTPSVKKETVEESPLHRKFTDTLNKIIAKTSGPAATTLRVFSEFKVAHKKFEDILNNLPSITGFVPDTEYAQLTTLAEEGAAEESGDLTRFEAEVVTDAPEPSSVVLSESVPKYPRQTPKKIPEPVTIRPTVNVEHPHITVKDVRERGVSAPPPIVTEQEKNVPSEVSYPEWLIPEPPPVVNQESLIPVEDPSARVKSLNERMSEAVVAAQPVEMSQAAVEKLSTTHHEEPIGPSRYGAEVDFNKLTEKYTHTKESLQNDLAKARQAFAQQEALYKQELNKGKKSYYEMMVGLGAPAKQRPLPTKTPEYLEAEKAHMEAKWNLKNFSAGLNIREIPIERSHSNSLIAPREAEVKIVDVGVFEKMETENRVFWNTVEAFMPEKEKKNWRRKVDAGLEAWSRIPLAARLPLTTVILVGGTYLAGNIGVAAALSTAGWRIGRAALGTGAALKAGKYFDGIKRKKREGDKEERKSDYDGAILSEKESFSKIDEASRQKIEKENKEIKNDRLKKAGIMAAVGGITTIGTGLVHNMAAEAFATPGVKINPDINSGTKPKGSLMGKFVKEDSPSESVSVPKVVVPEKIVETPTQVYTTPVEVDLSSKGFIDTVDQLKQATAGQKLTPALEKLFDQSPQKIAMDLGLYKPGQVAESAFGFQGEQLAIDAEGNVSLVHNSGATEVLMDSKGTPKPFVGKMFDADKLATSPMPTDAVEVPAAPKVAEVIPQTPKPVIEPIQKVSNGVEIKSSVSKFDVAADAVTPATALAEVKPRVPLEFDQTVVKTPEYTGSQDMVFGKLPLKPELQFDPKYKPERTAYNIRLEKELMSMPSDIFDLRFPIEYNGGRINVIQKGKDLLIFLNGEEIGTGLIVDGQPGLQYKKSLGEGMFGSKTDYQKAFEAAEKGIMKNKMFFKKTQ